MHLVIAVILGLAAGSVVAQPPFGAAPPEAGSACSGKSPGSSCSFIAPHGRVSGSCREVLEGLRCVPEGMGSPPNGGMSPQGMAPSPGVAGGSRPRAAIAFANPEAIEVSSRIPDTGQGSCFDTQHLIPCPRPGERFYGQDAQYLGAAPAYRDNGDGTVSDQVTGLMWQQGHNATRLPWYAARQACDTLNLGGYEDWRLPTIRELYSITDFRGAAGSRPYLNEVFEIREPDASILVNDRFAASHRTDMMGQTWSSTIYSGDHWDRKGVEAAFFMNFLDGRIKQAPTSEARGLLYRCVRGKSWGATILSTMVTAR